MKLKINEERYIGDGCRPYIIAEAGINHNGKIDLAKKLIYEAARNGADAIKFQKRTIGEMYTQEALNKPYDKPYAFGKTYGEHKEFLEFSDEQYLELQNWAKECGIEFIVSGFDYTSFDFINNVLKVAVHKIASPFITHFPLLKKVAEYGKPIILSTGMHTMEEVQAALDYIRQFNQQIVVLQATTLYPCPNEDANLNVLKSFRQNFDVLVGYSSHDIGVVLPAAAVALGACVIEKHFTLDRTMVGPDHIASVEPRGLELVVKYCQNVFLGLGSFDKLINEKEYPQRLKYGVSIVSACNIKAGEKFTDANITVKCPGGGISPRLFSETIGKVACKDIPADSLIYEADVR